MLNEGATVERSGFGFVDRRTFLAGLGATGVLLLSGCELTDPSSVPPVDPRFPFGIAAGDPAPDGAVIWTKVATPSNGQPVSVLWEVATDDTFATVVASGTTEAVADHDFTVHVRVGGLASDGWYRYRFRAAGATSRVGRLRTAPDPDAPADLLRFAWCSCQQINDSTYVAHLAMASESIDFWVHYGDYIYVHDQATLTVDDYRAKYRQFKANPFLQHLHARFPVVAMWDDGEFVNGVDRTIAPARAAAAKQAWFEYQPVERPTDDPNRVYRRLQWGTLADFVLVDVRQYRDPHPEERSPGTVLPLPVVDTATESGVNIFDPSRVCLGADQKQWLKQQLLASTATWRHIGQGYNFLAMRMEDYDTPAARATPPPGFHVNGGKYLASDAWDNYWAERRELMDFLAVNHIPNLVVTAGETHIFLAGPLHPDFDDLEGSPLVGHEFVCGSLTADPDVREEYLPTLPPDEAETVLRAVEQLFLDANPQVDYMDMVSQGYGIMTLTPELAGVSFHVIDTYDADAEPSIRAMWLIPAEPLEGAATRPRPRAQRIH